jgi:putative endonuclease
MSKRKTSYTRGLDAEEKAIKHLKSRGYEILEHRFKTPNGEIDIIAAKDKTIIAVEVKIRKNIDNAMLSISPRSSKRIEDAMVLFLQKFPHFNEIYPFIRFDVVLLSCSGEITHIENFWQTDGKYW